MFVPRYQDAIIAAISERVAKWTGLPIVNQEAMQVGSPGRHGSHLPLPYIPITQCQPYLCCVNEKSSVMSGCRQPQESELTNRYAVANTEAAIPFGLITYAALASHPPAT